MTSEKYKITHYVGLKDNQNIDCISREIHLGRFANNLYQLRLVTKWLEDEDPVVSTINFSHVGLEMMQSAISSILNNRSDWVYNPENHL